MTKKTNSKQRRYHEPTGYRVSVIEFLNLKFICNLVLVI